jgi:hypothetical protein
VALAGGEATRTVLVRNDVPSEKRVAPVTGLVRAVRPSVNVVVPVTGLVRAVAPLSQTIIPVDRLVRQVCAPAPVEDRSAAQASNKAGLNPAVR